MISEVRPRCSTAQGRSLPVIFLFLRIGQLGWDVLEVPAKTSIHPEFSKRGGEKFSKKEYFRRRIFGLF